MIIKTKRFVLRPYRKSDKADLIRSINDRDVSRFMLRVSYPYTSKDADIYLKKAFSRMRKNVKVFAIEIDGELVGGCGIHPNEHQAEIGYWLAKKHWGKGIVTEVIKELVKHGFGKMKLKRITAKVFLQNKASVRVLEKNRFKLEGILRKDILKDGKYHDVYLFAKIK